MIEDSSEPTVSSSGSSGIASKLIVFNDRLPSGYGRVIAMFVVGLSDVWSGNMKETTVSVQGLERVLINRGRSDGEERM